jgi:hypothetical protein
LLPLVLLTQLATADEPPSRPEVLRQPSSLPRESLAVLRREFGRLDSVREVAEGRGGAEEDREGLVVWSDEKTAAFELVDRGDGGEAIIYTTLGRVSVERRLLDAENAAAVHRALAHARGAGLLAITESAEVRFRFRHLPALGKGLEGTEVLTSPAAFLLDDRHGLSTSKKVDLDDVGRASDHAEALGLIGATALSSPLVRGREDLERRDDLSRDHVAHLEVSLLHGVRHRKRDGDGLNFRERGSPAFGSLDPGGTTPHEAHVGTADEGQPLRFRKVRPLLDGHPVLRAQPGCEGVSEGLNKAMVDIGPEVRMLQVGIHARKRSWHRSISVPALIGSL